MCLLGEDKIFEVEIVLERAQDILASQDDFCECVDDLAHFLFVLSSNLSHVVRLYGYKILGVVGYLIVLVVLIEEEVGLLYEFVGVADDTHLLVEDVAYLGCFEFDEDEDCGCDEHDEYEQKNYSLHVIQSIVVAGLRQSLINNWSKRVMYLAKGGIMRANCSCLVGELLFLCHELLESDLASEDH